MKKPVKMRINPDEYMQARLYLTLMLPESNEFKRVSTSNKPTNRTDGILLGLNVEFKNVSIYQRPNNQINKLLKKEIESSIFKNKSLLKIFQSVSEDDILSIDPPFEPKTNPILIGEYLISRDNNGLIGKTSIDELENKLI